MSVWALVTAIALAQGVPPRLMRAIVWIESRGRSHPPDSKHHAQGLCQLTPQVQHTYGVRDPYDAADNARGAARYLHSLRVRLGSWRLAVGGYGCGPARARKCGRYVREVYRRL